MSNVVVIPRFRPLNKRELSEAGGANVVVKFESDNMAFSMADPISKKDVRFTFDHVLPPEISQVDAYKLTAEPLLEDIFKGYNATLFTYGQTGSGKTFSMMGVMEDPVLKGIIPRIVEGVFNHIANAESSIEFTVKVSYVEIYNEKIRDLMCIEKDNLKVRESNSGVWIEDVTQTYVRDCAEVFDVLKGGGENRAVSATKMNAESSRSHSVFIVTVGQKDSETGSVKGAKLTLVDLAGSEKVGKTGADGQTLKEAQHINKSLSALGNVINALTTQPAAKPGQKKAPTGHIPYRDSKLTYLLSDSLGGNSKTCLLITGSPSAYNAEETLSTIRFGNRAKNIKNKPKVNQEKSVAEYQRLLTAANAKIDLLQAGQGLLETEVGILRHALCMLDPAAGGLANGKTLIDMVASATVRSSVGTASRAHKGHPDWIPYIALAKEASAGTPEPEAAEGLTIDDIMAEMGQSDDEGAAASGSIAAAPIADAADAGADPDADEVKEIDAGADAPAEPAAPASGSAAAFELEESPFAAHSDSEEDEDEACDTVGPLAEVESSGKKPRVDRRVSSLSFTTQSRELLEATERLEQELEEAHALADERADSHRAEVVTLMDQLQVLEKRVVEADKAVVDERARGETACRAVEEAWAARAALDKHRLMSTLAEARGEAEQLAKEKTDLESAVSASKRAAKTQAAEVAELRGKYDEAARKHAQQELVLEQIRSKHGDNILSELTDADTRLGVDVLARAQEEAAAAQSEWQRASAQLSVSRDRTVALVTALQRKSAAHAQSQLTLSACKVHIDMLERALFAVQQRVDLAEASYTELADASAAKLQAAESMVQELYKSGMYWKRLGSRYNTGGLIVTPLLGGNNSRHTVPAGGDAGTPAGRNRAHSVIKAKLSARNKNQSTMDAFF